MRKHLSRVLTSSFCLLFVTVTVQATPILVGTTTDATGVNGLIVGGVEYDVTFSFVSYNDTFGASVPTFFGDAAGGDTAAVALAQAMESFGVIGLNGVVLSPLQTQQLALSIPVANFPSGQINEAIAFSVSPGVWLTQAPGGCATCNVDAVPNPGRGWAVFSATTSPVPEPTAFALIGLGLYGLAFARRGRRS